MKLVKKVNIIPQIKCLYICMYVHIYFIYIWLLMMQVYKYFMQYNQVLVVKYFMIRKENIKIKKLILHLITIRFLWYFKNYIKKTQKRDANINALHGLCYKLKKEKLKQHFDRQNCKSIWNWTLILQDIENLPCLLISHDYR